MPRDEAGLPYLDLGAVSAKFLTTVNTEIFLL